MMEKAVALCPEDYSGAGKCQKDKRHLCDRTISLTAKCVLYSDFELRSGRSPKVAQSWHWRMQNGDTPYLDRDADLGVPPVSQTELACRLRERLERYRRTNGPALFSRQECNRMGPRLLGETIQSWLSAKAKLQICFPFHSNPGYETPGGFHKSDSPHPNRPSSFSSSGRVRITNNRKTSPPVKNRNQFAAATTRPKRRALPSHRRDVVPSGTDHPSLVCVLAV